MTSRRDKKKAAVRQALYEAALQLFRTQGYEATSVASICAEAGVAKGTFFNHYPTKAHVLAHWYDAAMHAAAEQAVADHAPLTEALQARAIAALTLARAEPELWRAKHALAPQDRDIQASEAQADARITAQAAERIRAAQAAGDIAAQIDPDPLADVYVGLVTGTIRQWLNTGERFDLEDALRVRIATLIGLAST